MLRFLAEQCFVDFNISDQIQETPLYGAIKNQRLDMVKFLVEECGADIEHREVQLRSPLYYSASKGNMEITKYLAAKGADPNAKTAMGRTALLKATWNGEVELVRVLLEQPAMDIH